MPFAGGTTDFERILPGPNRMYPDTDSPPMPIEDALVRRIAARLPQLPWTREENLKRQGLSEEWARKMCVSPHFPLFEEITKKAAGPGPSRVVAWVFLELWKALRRGGVPVASLSEQDLRDVLQLFVTGRLAREGLAVVLERLARLKGSALPVRIEAILQEEFPEVALGKTPLEPEPQELHGLFEPYRKSEFPGEAQRVRTLMKAAMKRYRGVAEGKRVFAAVEAWCRKRPMEEKVVELKSRRKVRP
jgi:Glu-tRNA(Gln) amidotransferase subunit E-like FAD-binding protein